MNKKIATALLTGTVATASVLSAGILYGQEVNPYEDHGDRFSMGVVSDLQNAGEQKIEVKKEKPEVRIKKWNGEVDFGLLYDDIKDTGKKSLFNKKIEFRGAKKEMAVYPIDADNFEIDITLKEKPKSNIITFTLQNWQDFDFFYQPPLNEEMASSTCTETDCGGMHRPENVVRSYAVYAKDKKNYCTNCGTHNYGTGKIGHFFRPRIVDSAGTEVWGELHIQNGTLSVTIPQDFLDNAVYPVKQAAGLTFGFTGEGATTGALTCSTNGQASGSQATGAAGTGVSMSVYGYTSSASKTIQMKIYDASRNEVANGITDVASAPTSLAWTTINFTSAPTLTAQTYHLMVWTSALCPISASGFELRFDSGGSSASGATGSNTYNTWPATVDNEFSIDSKYSIYLTYTSGGTVAVPNGRNTIFFE